MSLTSTIIRSLDEQFDKWVIRENDLIHSAASIELRGLPYCAVFIQGSPVRVGWLGWLRIVIAWRRYLRARAVNAIGLEKPSDK